MTEDYTPPVPYSTLDFSVLPPATERLDRFLADLADMRQAIEAGDGDTLFDLFTRTRAIRRGIIDQGQDDAAPDFGRQHD